MKNVSYSSALTSSPLQGRKSSGGNLEYRALSEAAFVAAVNQCGKIILVNAQLERCCGYGQDELIGRSADIMV